MCNVREVVLIYIDAWGEHVVGETVDLKDIPRDCPVDSLVYVTRKKEQTP